VPDGDYICECGTHYSKPTPCGTPVGKEDISFMSKWSNCNGDDAQPWDCWKVRIRVKVKIKVKRKAEIVCGSILILDFCF